MTDTIRTIETDRLVLRPMTNADAADLLSLGGDAATAYWAGMEPLKDIKDAEEMIYWGNVFADEPQYAITEKGADKVVGVISASYGWDMAGEPELALGYLLSPEVTRRGYMTEAVKAVCGDIFENTRWNKVMLEIRPDNIPSRGVAAKCGFVQNAAQREWRLNHYGKPLDEFFLYTEKESDPFAV